MTFHDYQVDKDMKNDTVTLNSFAGLQNLLPAG